MTTAESHKEVSDALSALVRDYLAPMMPGKMISSFLEASFDPDVQAPRLAALIESNPLYAQYLQKLDILQEKVKMWREEFPEDTGTERLTQFIVALLGASVTRNAVLSIWLSRVATPGLPKKQGVPFVLIPRMQLRYALAGVEYCDENNIANSSDLAYMAGLCFDWTSALMERKGGVVKSEKKYVEELWSEALKSARVAYELSMIPKNLVLSRYAFSSTLLVYVGKALMAASFPKDPAKSGMNWKEFLKHCEGHAEHALKAQMILEKRKFALTHSEIAALCASIFPLLRPAESAIRFYQEPYLLKKSAHDGYFLGTIVSSAIELAASKSSKAMAGLKELRISEIDVQTALARAKKKG